MLSFATAKFDANFTCNKKILTNNTQDYFWVRESYFIKHWQNFVDDLRQRIEEILLISIFRKGISYLYFSDSPATYPTYLEFSRHIGERSPWFSNHSGSSQRQFLFSATPFVLWIFHRRTRRHSPRQPRLHSGFALCCSRMSWTTMEELPIECHFAVSSRE